MHSPFGFVATGLVLSGVMTLGTSCSGGADPIASTDKYTQTWTKTYSATTCAEWGAEMSSAQQWAAAADMLTGARNKGDGGVGLPPDVLITQFAHDVTVGCSAVGTVTVAETGASIYLIGRAKYQP